MNVQPLDLPGILLLHPRRFDDDRGSFAEIYNQDKLAPVLGLEQPFVQDNWSRSLRAKTVRALHFQRRPYPQGKLVRVTRGCILDVAVDVRAGSETYGRHLAVWLSADDLSMVWIPAGFAHGYVTLEDETEVTYKVTHRWDQASEVGIVWNDPELGIDWGVSEADATIAERDRALPPFSALVPF